MLAAANRSVDSAPGSIRGVPLTHETHCILNQSVVVRGSVNSYAVALCVSMYARIHAARVGRRAHLEGIGEGDAAGRRLRPQWQRCYQRMLQCIRLRNNTKPVHQRCFRVQQNIRLPGDCKAVLSCLCSGDVAVYIGHTTFSARPQIWVQQQRLFWQVKPLPCSLYVSAKSSLLLRAASAPPPTL